MKTCHWSKFLDPKPWNTSQSSTFYKRSEESGFSPGGYDAPKAVAKKSILSTWHSLTGESEVFAGHSGMGKNNWGGGSTNNPASCYGELYRWQLGVL